ncbi:hypothetical protein K443DRAFT_634718 [Laccaria amethystina LaAM-08-1]|uniref:Unplaced genomic scaffold K443scaffold_184, whole genome shotgun sequence n=1 Tax=Laccaria amethystina LaAM-08-1 TaxID=1095629 RepID=A0A0C9XFS1_9AGAR|nr:hypothetical protein K443DRAFT_634718 [Laccaria amethystina LaAM-08-1]
MQGSINSCINILYFLNSLCETCLLVLHSSSSSSNAQPSTSTAAAAAGGTDAASGSYVVHFTRDLRKIVELVVPEGRQGLPNLISTKQILESWRSKRVIDPATIHEVIEGLNGRGVTVNGSSMAAGQEEMAGSIELNDHDHQHRWSRASWQDAYSILCSHPFEPHHHQQRSLSRSDVFKRIEEDRERHKRLRERRWVQPVGLVSFVDDEDVEFENKWETTSDWNEDDDEAVAEEVRMCFPCEERMDLG